MSSKKGIDIPGFFEYTVYPLEGFWDLTEIGRKSNFLLKDELIYTIMIKQPSFVTKDIFETMLNIVKKQRIILTLKNYILKLSTKDYRFKCYISAHTMKSKKHSKS